MCIIYSKFDNTGGVATPRSSSENPPPLILSNLEYYTESNPFNRAGACCQFTIESHRLIGPVSVANLLPKVIV